MAAETIEGGKLLKGGNYSRKYGTYLKVFRYYSTVPTWTVKNAYLDKKFWSKSVDHMELLELLGAGYSVELIKFVPRVMCSECSDLVDHLKAPVKPIMGLQTEVP